MDRFPLSKIAEFAQGHVSYTATAKIRPSRTSARIRARCSRAIFSSPCAGKISTGTSFVEQAERARRRRRDGRPELDRQSCRADFALLRVDDTLVAYQNRGELPKIASAESRRHHRQQRQDQHKRFCRRRPRRALPGHENRRQFQQSRRSSANDAGSDIARTKSACGKSG